MSIKINLEVCAESVHSAIEGQKGGAVRIELCNNLSIGGTTPSISQIELARKYIDIQLSVLIRPRGGDFLYTDLEYEVMMNDIHYCGKSGCNGVVFGILNSQGVVDVERNRNLLQIAHQYNMSTTFHRAFDRCADLSDSMKKIIDLGFNRILTSGGMKTAVEGKDVLKRLISDANDEIVIMPGGGITENNIYDLVSFTKLKEFHGSFQSSRNSEMKFISHSFNLNEDFLIKETDYNRVRKTIQNANSL